MKQELAALARTSDDDAKERRRDRILREGTTLFLQQGYRKTSVDDIARKAGIAKGTIYLYFANKSEILFQAILDEKRRALGEILPLFARGIRPSDRLRLWIELTLRMAQEMPLVARLLRGDHELVAALDEQPADAMRRGDALGLDFAAQVIEEAIAPARLDREALEERAKLVHSLGYFASLLGEERVRQGLSLHRYAALLADTIATGLHAAAKGASARRGSSPRKGKTA